MKQLGRQNYRGITGSTDHFMASRLRVWIEVGYAEKRRFERTNDSYEKKLHYYYLKNVKIS